MKATFGTTQASLEKDINLTPFANSSTVRLILQHITMQETATSH